MIRYLLVSLILLLGYLAYGQKEVDISKERKYQFRQLLGSHPENVPLGVDTLEKVQIQGGTRLKISFVSELPDTTFHTPIDRINAYLFVPDHKSGDRLPAIVAIHQDGPQAHIGKSEPAGLAGADDMHYGLELFQRGYVVICPDRFYHAERRRITGADTAGTDWDRNSVMLSHWTGQLLLQGRNPTGKEAYDLSRSVDVLHQLEVVDTSKIGAIGHSAGGAMLVYFMFLDERIKVGVSSCGFNEVINFYGENEAKKRGADSAIPGLSKIGKGTDYLALLAPRPILLTRGLWEWGMKGKWRQYSIDHVQETKDIVDYVKPAYHSTGYPENIAAIYFEEANGQHAFPPGVKRQAYEWLDRFLK